jgi:hypothetical protein
MSFLEVLVYAVSYFTVGTVLGRYCRRSYTRMERLRPGDPRYRAETGDFWGLFFGWPLTVFLWANDVMTISEPNGFISYLTCAREPKQVRRRERLKQLKAENDAKEKELLNAL